MMRKLIFGCVVLICLSCTNTNSTKKTTVDSLVFGHYYGFCVEQCFVPFKLTKTQLEIDGDETYLTQNYTFKATDTLSDTAFNNAFALLSAVPTDLVKAKPGKVYGCPDCTDQGGLYLEITKGNITTKVFIDNFNTPDQPASVLAFKEQVKEVINKIKP